MPMTSDFQVHRVTSADIELLRQLNNLFGEAFEDVDSYAGAPPDDGYLADVLAQNHVIVLAGLQGNTVVGGLVAYELPKLERSRSEIYIYDLAVAPRMRRQGIATLLIMRVREIAQARGAWVVFVQADHGDDAAIALYDKLGAREDVLHFDLPVP